MSVAKFGKISSDQTVNKSFYEDNKNSRNMPNQSQIPTISNIQIRSIVASDVFWLNPMVLIPFVCVRYIKISSIYSML